MSGGLAGAFGVEDEPNRTALGLGALFVGLVVVRLWASAVAIAVRPVSEWLFGPQGVFFLTPVVAALAGFCPAALGYARLRGLRIGFSLPSRRAWRPAVAAVVVPVALVAGTGVIGNAVFDTPLSAMIQRWIASEISMPALLAVGVIPSVFVGVGYAFVFCGMVYERVRQLVPGQVTVGVAVAVVGFFWLLPVDGANAVLTGGGAVEALLSAVFGGGFAVGLGILSRSGWSVTGLGWRQLAVLGVAAVGVFGVATDLTDPGAAGELLRAVALGVALVGYARTRSVWVSALAIAGFETAVVGVVYVESLAGVAAP